ncbi:hypothetical protein Kpol_1002p122 [Vanderwaltozyma polyspora DSM 70294]|uniref:J domain-containing protein n=1 Tax=Vanderwaltozyma polyspora (strain ATCC 22028 / DSM 70294 / BCRC 21397 / CBS 2163 / NBRC 10782 / NRRL Y-8283 / UCD 57-17) TaxID=436907 RepID=A7TEF0_VANPO|nr:uncharacterized protein Kpol_1002p122 [Vanderwaltozyma polyspora DSM 70294]EDO19472.1 hypothetical protein Kpol_1002p122 [Vanderwaltozyma polyspora DSM 70294]
MVMSSELYDILNISSNADAKDIKKAYRVLALKYHPDKNNHSEESKVMFQKISEAYEVLIDVEKRKLYDQYGTVDESVIEQMKERKRKSEFMQQRQGMYPSDPFGNVNPLFGSDLAASAGDLFAQFFGNSNKNSSRFNPFGNMKPNFSNFNNTFENTASVELERGPDIKHTLRCSLKDLYYGKKTKLRLDRTRLCVLCMGQGSMKKSKCFTCNGLGSLTQTRRMGPMIQTFSQSCPDCQGSGMFVKRSDTCQSCSGNGYVEERKIFDVEIQPGMVNGQVIILPGEADEVVNTSFGKQKVIAGDIVLTINQLKDNNFEVINDCDLLLDNFSVNLSKALCGGTIFISNHPSGNLIKIDIIPGEILSPGVIKTVANLGMPKEEKRDPDVSIINISKGNLYVKFDIKFPTRLEEDTIAKLKAVLSEDRYAHAEMADEEAKDVSNLDDLVEIEEHVFNNFEPDYRTIEELINNNSDGFNSTSNDFDDKSGRDSHKKRRFDEGYSNDGMQ